MPRIDEITSTEKLLDVIRKQKNALPDESSKDIGTSPQKKIKFPSTRIISLQKSVTVGVDIGHANLRLVKTQKLSDNTWKVIEYTNIPYPSTIARGTQEFADLLKDALNNFCGPEKKINIWAVMSAANIEVRHVRIPKVPKKQIENAVFWTFKKESPFDEKENIFDFEIQEEVIDQGVAKYSIMAYTAPKQEVEEIKRLFSRIGLPLAGISITPFAIQNIFRTNWIDIQEETVASLFIGNDFSRIDIFSKGNLVMTRGIKAGTNSMIEALTDVISDPSQSEFSTDKAPITRDQARDILFSLSPDSPALSEKDAGFGLKEEEIFDVILPALDRLVRQIERTFEYFTVNLGNKKINKIYISGVMDIYTPLVEYVGNQLGIDREILDPIGIKGSFKSHSGAPKAINISAMAAFVPALGLALSDNLHTPNLSFTYKDKEKALRVVFINRAIFTGFIAIIVACFVVVAYQSNAASHKRATLTRIERELLQYNPRIDRNKILLLVGQNKQRRRYAKVYGERYAGMAVISEVSSLTPENIRLIDLKITLGSNISDIQNVTKKETTSDLPKEAGTYQFGSLVVEGIVSGDQRKMDATLAEYILKLNSSPMFHGIVIQKSGTQSLKRGDFLQFTLSAKIG